MDTAVDVRASALRTSSSTRTLLACGAVAGPLFIVVAFAQALTRGGYEFANHPLSLLSNGELGWVQILNFVLAGALFIACAIGMRHALDPDKGGTWAPRLFVVFGLGLIAGGVFVPDQAFGFPPGTASGMPDQISWHSVGHAIAFPVGFAALVASAFVMARRHLRLGERGWAALSLSVGVVVLALSLWPNIGGDPEGRFAPLWVAMILGFAWASTTAIRLGLQPKKPSIPFG
jgi:hypothetical protein